MVANLIVLDVFMLRHSDTIETLLKRQDATAQLLFPLLIGKRARQATQKQSIASPVALDTKASGSAKKLPAPSPTFAPTATPLPVVVAPSQYFVPFGNGQSTAQTWTNVPGLAVQINTGAYPNIKQVNFVASITIPTGNETASVQLYNVTLGHVVWNSTMSMSGGATQMLTSNPITLDPGVNTYQVQMMTQLQYPALLNNSYLTITTY